MTKFNEKSLELSIMELFELEGYTHIDGETLHRERSEVLLYDDLKDYLYRRYKSEDITENEINSIILMIKSIGGTIYEANKTFCNYLSNGFLFNREDRTKKDLYIELLDFENRLNNTWKIVNQFEIEGINNQRRIPDSILYINGLPVAIFEFKSAIKENTTIKDAYNQLTIRYKRDIPEIFKYNVVCVISDGVNSKYGTLFTPYDYYYSWNKIEKNDSNDFGINSLITLVKGMFRFDRFLEIIKDYTYFPDNSDKDLKVVCRYPQYFASKSLFDSIKKHQKPDGDGKGGTYFGATSYAMLFLTRLLMKSKYFNSPTILLITDRNDLDSQLSSQFLSSKKYIGDNNIVNIESRENLGTELRGRTSGGVYLTTIQKFTEDISLLSDRNNIICISDEAHRTQTNIDEKVDIDDKKNIVNKHYGFAKYLHDSLPNAIYVGFTGTPIDATLDVFGDIVDSYTMTESVKDGITVNLVYDGRAAKVTLDKEKLNEIEKYYDICEQEGTNEYQIEASKKAATNLDVILGDKDRLKAIAKDFIKHYEKRVEEGATVKGKAMFVCSNRYIAYDLWKIIIEMRPEWNVKKECEENCVLDEKDKKELKPIEKIKMVMTRNKDDEEDLYNLLGTKEDRKELDRQFKNEKSNFKIAIVVDMWLTGFDVPCLDTIYIDKPIKEHSLIQTISRVNRVYQGKDKGLIVDYIGIKKNMNLALKKYTKFEKEEFEGIEESINIVKDQLEVLNNMFNNFDDKKYFSGTPLEQLMCLKEAVEFVQTTEDMEHRFMFAVRKLKKAYNLCTSSEKIVKNEREYINFYCGVRSILFKLNHGEAPDIEQMNAKVRELIENAIQSDGVEELFVTSEHINVDIFSDEYIGKINSIEMPNTKVKLLEKLLKMAISEFKKVNKITALDFSERLKKIVEIYNDRSKDEALAKEVLNDVADKLTDLLSSLKTEKNSFDQMGISYEEKAFYDILIHLRNEYKFVYGEDVPASENVKVNEKCKALARKMKAIIDGPSVYSDWLNNQLVRNRIKFDIKVCLVKNGYPPKYSPDVFRKVMKQVENYKQNQ